MAAKKIEGASTTVAYTIHPDSIAELVQDSNVSRHTHESDESIRELANSIAAQGQLQDILLRYNSERKLTIIAGYRRTRAVELINDFPGDFKDAEGATLTGPISLRARIMNVTEREALEMNLEENLRRKDLNTVDLARAARTLIDRYEWSAAQVAERMHCSPARVSQLTGLLILPESALNALASGKIKEATARGFIGAAEETITKALAMIDAGDKPNLVVRAIQAGIGAKRRLGVAEIVAALEGSNSAQGDALAKWIRGEGEFSAAKLGDFEVNADAEIGEDED